MIAQNGIQLSQGSTGSIQGNTFSGFGFQGSGWASAALLVYNTVGLLVDGNNFAGTGDNDNAIYLINSDGATVTNNTIDGFEFGVIEYGQISTSHDVVNTGADANTYTNVEEANHYLQLNPATQKTVVHAGWIRRYRCLLRRRR
ncbi:hypothetical protein [Breoghania sp.]|uniref:right-handed parallel beta-helix repeat-containing protein n=1 Tax=Breoghania sp. TaxID=2065378 RepID=UPI00260D41D7|nr:hypothetical protein [Breoghania sp.]MDJ0929811.1 hypothetical protein [Breoghania sp.]